MKKPVWRNNFNVGKVLLSPIIEIALCINDFQAVTVKKRIITKGIYILDHISNIGSYFLKDQLHELAMSTLREMIGNPAHIDEVHKKTIAYNQKYFDFAESIRRTDLTKLSDKKLVSFHNELFHLQYISHGWALCTTWFVDSEDEIFTNYLLNILKEKTAASEVPEIFRVLTTPAKTSLGQQEEMESLKIVGLINEDPRLKKWFTSHTTSELMDDFKNLPAKAGNIMRKHFQKWRWFPYGYLGPAYNLDYYLEVWRGLLHQDIKAKKELENIKIKAEKNQTERKKIIGKIGLNSLEKHLFDMAAEIIWIKSFRKDCYYHGFFAMDLIFSEVARRAGMSSLQAKYLAPGELKEVLRGKNLIGVVNERMKFCVVYNVGKKISILTGKNAKRFLKKYRFEVIKADNFGQLRGTCACPGKVKGTVRIVNTPEEMKKMEDGDIMVSHTTYPALVPAMKKAGAIVTEDGGITCHAAIVSREMQTPCVVGCKNALNILKDGDMVEVDANNAIIKIIK